MAFDIVEVAPPYDNSELTVQVAAKLMQDILAARFPLPLGGCFQNSLPLRGRG